MPDSDSFLLELACETSAHIRYELNDKLIASRRFLDCCRLDFHLQEYQQIVMEIA